MCLTLFSTGSNGVLQDDNKMVPQIIIESLTKVIATSNND